MRIEIPLLSSNTMSLSCNRNSGALPGSAFPSCEEDCLFESLAMSNVYHKYGRRTATAETHVNEPKFNAGFESSHDSDPSTPSHEPRNTTGIASGEIWNHPFPLSCRHVDADAGSPPILSSMTDPLSKPRFRAPCSKQSANILIPFSSGCRTPFATFLLVSRCLVSSLRSDLIVY